MDPDAPDAGDLVAELAAYLAEQRADAAAASRARERWLRQAAAEEARVAGVLLDLAERAATVAVQGVGGRTHRGVVRAVGEDFAALRTGAGDVLVAYAAMAAIRPEGAAVAGSDRAQALDLGLAEALAAVAGTRPRVLVVARDGTGLAGELRSAGIDVLALAVDGGAQVFVPTAAIAEVTITPG